jgi:hypothetical protein
MAKFMNFEELNELRPSFDVTLLSQDTYNELEVYKSVVSVGVDKCFAIALQFSIVGVGKQKYGHVKVGNEDVDIEEFCKENNITIRNKVNSTLKPNELTPKRLSRLFRYQISTFIEKTGFVSFLFKKYCHGNHNPKFVFPSAEYLVLGAEADGLLEAYLNLDTILKTEFHSRAKNIVDVRTRMLTISK